MCAVFDSCTYVAENTVLNNKPIHYISTSPDSSSRRDASDVEVASDKHGATLRYNKAPQRGAV
jgi:hypothetical protein